MVRALSRNRRSSPARRSCWRPTRPGGASRRTSSASCCKPIENTAALEANLLSGGIDYIAGELGLTIDQAIAFEQRHGGDYDIIYKPVLFYEHLTCNLDNPILADKRVRQALLYALDRAAITQQLFGGRQKVRADFVSPLDWIFTAMSPQYAYDPGGGGAAGRGRLDRIGADGLRHNAPAIRCSSTS